MSRPPHFLLFDPQAEARRLLRESLLGRFPAAIVHESTEARHAVALAAVERLDALVLHGASDTETRTLLPILRAIDPAVASVVLHDAAAPPEDLAAQATRLLPFGEWPRLGAVVGEILALGRRAPPPLPGA